MRSDERATRRQVLRYAIGCGAALAVAPVLSQDDPASLRPRPGDLLIKVNDASLTPLGPGDIALGEAQTMAWAMDPADRTVRSGSRLNRVMLLRFPADRLSPETAARAADGVVAYTAICTHTGCEVIEWQPAEELLHCPCHYSTFDPRDGARVADGPAPRALPALPLKVADGRLVVSQAFTSRVGFDNA
jgi:Rieske Fe-S protein